MFDFWQIFKTFCAGYFFLQTFVFLLPSDKYILSLDNQDIERFVNLCNSYNC